MKCKILFATDPALLEKRINAFIQQKTDVVSVNINVCNGSGAILHYTAVILYEDWAEEE